MKLFQFLNQDAYSAILKADRVSQEPEKIKRWREEQKLRLTKKGIRISNYFMNRHIKILKKIKFNFLAFY